MTDSKSANNGGQEESEREVVEAPNPSEFESIGLALAEFRRRYDDEESHRTALENKAGGLLALDAIVLSIISQWRSASAAFLGVAVILLFVSGIVSALSIRGREYAHPFRAPGHIYAYADQPSSVFEGEVAELYKLAIEQTVEVNKEKSREVRLSFALTGGALLIIIVGTSIRIFSAWNSSFSL